MLLIKPVMVLIKSAVPAPSFVFVLNAIVGLAIVSHTTPFTEIVPQVEMRVVPPNLAEFIVIEVAADVVTATLSAIPAPVTATSLGHVLSVVTGTFPL